MRKDIKTNKVVKALALGLAATMAMTQPIEVMASTVSSGDSNDGGEGSATAENQQQENVTTVASAAQSANETIEKADKRNTTERSNETILFIFSSKKHFFIL